ncbi:MAG TPA: diheme cytochrome c-553 [Bacteroidota bacterium]|nr:diheme cytochrome c-553 [Bacteroidota bacterium]
MKSRVLVALAVVGMGCSLLHPGSAIASQKSAAGKKMIERGKYLVTFGSCNDCHSPKVFTPMGPIPDTTRLMSGSPSLNKLPEVPKDLLAPEKWGAITTNDLTAWAGPWGVSFARNLTPDVATGIGSWTEEIFIKALRTGKDMGEGRAILPPMPWQMIGQATDADLRAIFAYLKSLKPIENAVPDPISPTGERVPTMSAPKK